MIKILFITVSALLWNICNAETVLTVKVLSKSAWGVHGIYTVSDKCKTFDIQETVTVVSNCKSFYSIKHGWFNEYSSEIFERDVIFHDKDVVATNCILVEESIEDENIVHEYFCLSPLISRNPDIF